MSLSKLNDQLKADICSFLDFKDINKLAQVNKGIKAILQRRGLDKPRIHSLRFEEQEEEERGSDKLGCFLKLHSEDDMPQRVAELELDEGFVMNSSEVLNWINKFNTIEYLELNYIRLQDNAGWEHIDAKIRSVQLRASEITMSKETLMKFFKKFTLVTFGYGAIIDPAYITDEFNIELARVGTTVHYKDYIEQVVAVTDETLDVLSSRRIPSELFLEGLTTGITFARVKKMIEDALKTGMNKISYYFGDLKSDQYNETHHFMSEEFERWAEGFDRSLRFHYEDYEVLNYESYTIYGVDHSFYIRFVVKKPRELLQNDNDDKALNLLGNLEI